MINHLAPDGVSPQVACAETFTAVLDEDAQVTIIGLSPVTGMAVREPLDLPKEDSETKTALDVEAIAAGGTHVCLVMAERSAV
jgi:hypothetical protein